MSSGYDYGPYKKRCLELYHLEHYFLLHYAEDLHNEGRYEEAVAAGIEATNRTPLHGPLATLAKSHFALKQFDEAIDAITHAMKLAPAKFSYWGFRCHCLREQGKLDRAMFEYGHLMHVMASSGAEGWRAYIPHLKKCAWEGGDEEFIACDIRYAEELLEEFKRGGDKRYQLVDGEWRFGWTAAAIEKHLRNKLLSSEWE